MIGGQYRDIDRVRQPAVLISKVTHTVLLIVTLFLQEDPGQISAPALQRAEESLKGASGN